MGGPLVKVAIGGLENNLVLSSSVRPRVLGKRHQQKILWGPTSGKTGPGVGF